MKFKKIIPKHNLQPYIRNYWVFDITEEDIPFSQLLFPFGSFELIFNLLNAPQMKIVGDTDSFIQPDALFPGQFTKPFILSFTQVTKCIGVSLQPWMGKLLFNIPAQEFTNKITLLESIEDPAIFRPRLLDAMGDEALLLGRFENYLLNKLTNYHFDNVSAEIAKSIMHNPCSIAFKKIISSIGITRRRIEQRFLETTGLPMGFFARKIRFQKVVHLLRCGKHLSLTQIGLLAGYYDQSHFIREFKYFAGVTPTDFLKQTTDMTKFVSGLMVDHTDHFETRLRLN